MAKFKDYDPAFMKLLELLEDVDAPEEQRKEAESLESGLDMATC